MKWTYYKVLFASLEEKGEYELGIEERASGKNKEFWKEMILEGLVFIIRNLSNLEELKNCHGWSFWILYKFSNLMYIIIIFLKLKIY